MRNNEERLGTNFPVVPDITPSQPQNLSFPSPTELVDLPTQGKFYPSDHPLYNQPSIEIKFMTSAEEDILTSKSFLRKGIAIDKMLQSLLINKTINLDSLFVCDKNALIIAARISGYGAEYSSKIICPVCEEKIDYNFDLENIKPFHGDESILSQDGTITLELPKTKFKVVCRLLTGKDEKYLSQLSETKKKHHLPEKNVTDQIKMFVISINDSTDTKIINQTIDSLPTFDSKYLRTMYQKSIPSISLDYSITCPECESESEVLMPIGTTFFWPK